MRDGRASTPPGPDRLPVDPDAPEVIRPPRQGRHGRPSAEWDVLVAVGAGGALGALARWAVSEVLPWSGAGFPWATFVENVSGALALGVLMVLLLDVWPPRRYLRPFLGVGVLGGYTTFSTYMLEAHDLLVAGEQATALGYLAGSLAAGLVAVWLGITLARAGVSTALRRRAATGDPAEPDPHRSGSDPRSTP